MEQSWMKTVFGANGLEINELEESLTRRQAVREERRRSTSALLLCMKEYQPDDLEEFRVSWVPIVHASRVIRPCALNRLRLDAERPQDSAHPRWLHVEQLRQFQNCDSHQSRQPPLIPDRL